MFEQWIGLVDEVYSFPFANEADKITWKWNMKSGLFTTKSVYNHLSFGEVGLHYRHIWKAKIPYKIKIFVWMLEQNAILTKYNMIRRRWVGDPTCYFCSLPESCGHLFFQCRGQSGLGGWSVCVLVQTTSHRTWRNSKAGYRLGCLGVE